MRLPWARHRRARLTAARNSNDFASWARAVSMARRKLSSARCSSAGSSLNCASPLGVEGLLTNPITSGGGYGGEANPAALLLSFGSKTTVFDTCSGGRVQTGTFLIHGPQGHHSQDTKSASSRTNAASPAWPVRWLLLALGARRHLPRGRQSRARPYRRP